MIYSYHVTATKQEDRRLSRASSKIRESAAHETRWGGVTRSEEIASLRFCDWLASLIPDPSPVPHSLPESTANFALELLPLATTNVKEAHNACSAAFNHFRYKNALL